MCVEKISRFDVWWCQVLLSWCQVFFKAASPGQVDLGSPDVTKSIPWPAPKRIRKKTQLHNFQSNSKSSASCHVGFFYGFFFSKNLSKHLEPGTPSGALPQSLATSFTQTPYIELQVLLRPYWPYHMVPYILKNGLWEDSREMGEEWYTCFHMSHTVCCLPNTSCCYNQNICIYIYTYIDYLPTMYLYIVSSMIFLAGKLGRPLKILKKWWG